MNTKSFSDLNSWFRTAAGQYYRACVVEKGSDLYILVIGPITTIIGELMQKYKKI
jgi:hypothetical protein